MSNHLVVPDPHAHPEHDNERADWLGKLILDLKPDVVINMGDLWDFPSMSAYEKGKAMWGRMYQDDLDSGLDFNERMWHPLRHAKKKQPRKVFLEGNHENRMKKLLNDQPQLEGLLDWADLDLDRHYHDVITYEGGVPGFINIDGVSYAHYHISGVMGKPIGGIHQGSQMCQKIGCSATMGHTHTRNFFEMKHPAGPTRLGMVCGVFQDYRSGWAGNINDVWWPGVVYKRGVENGVYSHQWISLESLRKEYGN